MGRRARAMRTSRVARSWRPAGLAGRAAVRWAGTYLAWGGRRKAKREQFVLRTAEDVTRTMGEMKGAVMKVGQVMSLMTGLVPDEMAGQLASLQANAPPMAYALVEAVFREEYGRGPGDVFRRFEREPFAAASIGQVHRAELADGTAVAVKVQYPGVREAIEHDLANMGLFLGFSGMVSPGLDAGPIIHDLNEGIRGELDYLREAEWQQQYYDTFAGHAFIRVPRVYHELTTARVLVQEYMRGRPFREALALDQAGRNRVAEMVFRFAFGNFYRHHRFNGDPHPGNYLLLDDGTVAFLDYGCVTPFDRAIVDQFREMLFGLYEHDLPRWRAAAEDIGILRPGAPYTTQELYDHMHWFWKPVLEDEVTFTPALAGEMVRHNTAATGHEGAINRHLNIPPGMVFLSRINFGLAGLLASLNALGPWRGIVGEYLYGGPPVTELGRLSAATTRVGEPV